MLQRGIATVTQIREDTSANTRLSGDVTSQFGLSKALSSLFKVDLTATGVASKTSGSSASLAEERVHTPSSLFFTLRRLMREREVLVQDGVHTQPIPGQMIEFSATLIRNPVLEVLDAFLGMAGFGELFSKTSAKHNVDLKQMRQIKQALEEFRKLVAAGDTVDLTTNTLECGYSAVVTVEQKYLNDPTMSDLVDGTFRVLGKVTRASRSGAEGVSLIRKTAFSRMPRETLENAVSSLNAFSVSQSFRLPSVALDVPPPVIQVIPVAIYA
jgi:hypothetical protein